MAKPMKTLHLHYPIILFLKIDGYSIPSVDCLFSPTLDNSVLNQISPLKSRKYTEGRDKDLASVQRSMLNITAPFVAYMMLYVQTKMYPKMSSHYVC